MQMFSPNKFSSDPCLRSRSISVHYQVRILHDILVHILRHALLHVPLHVLLYIPLAILVYGHVLLEILPPILVRLMLHIFCRNLNEHRLTHDGSFI